MCSLQALVPWIFAIDTLGKWSTKSIISHIKDHKGADKCLLKYSYIYIKVYTYYCLNICISIKKMCPCWNDSLIATWLWPSMKMTFLSEASMQAGGSHRGEEHRFLDAAKVLPSLMNAVIVGPPFFLLGTVFWGVLLKGKTCCKSASRFFFNLFLDTGRLPSIDNYSLFVLFTCLFVHHILHHYFATCHPTKIF